MVAHIDVSTENFASFCNQFPKDGGRSSCFARGSMLFERSTTHGPEIHAFCELSRDPDIIEACYDMVFALVGSGSEYNVEKIGGICETVNTDRRGQCYGSAAINMIDADPTFVPRMAELCMSTKSDEARDDCFSDVSWYAAYRFNEGTPEFATLCTTIPSEHRLGSCAAYK